MKRRITLSIALALSVVLLAFMSSDSTAQAQRNRSYSYASGIVILGVNQKLVVTVNSATATEFVFQEMRYGMDTCSGTICKHLVTNEQFFDIMTAIGEGASDTLAYSANATGAYIRVVSKNPNLTVTSQIILNDNTGEEVIVSSTNLIGLLVP